MFNVFFLWRREQWRTFWRSRSALISISLSTVTLVALWYLASIFPPQASVTLRYSIYVGINQLTEPWMIYLVPLVATFFVGLNTALAYVLARHTILMKHVWLWMSSFLSLGFFWHLVVLYRLNT